MKRNFIQRYLDPGSALGEVLFGLVMMLTITLAAGLTAGGGEEGGRRLLGAAIGCNLAWGIIDAMMYVLNALFERSHRTRIVQAIQRVPREESALAAIREQLEPRLESLAGREACEDFYAAVHAQLGHARPARTRLTRDDLLGALASFILVVLSCFPAAVPFLLIDSPYVALRVSNILLLVMLFGVGWHWARYTNVRRWQAGLAMLLLGLVLVGVAICLGG